MKNAAGHTLRLTRIVLAALAFATVTGLFTAAGMWFPRFARFIARVQLLPAALSFAMGIFVAWLIVTLLFGRVYCSTVCPLGVFQDIVSRTARPRRREFHYKAPRNRLRYAFLTLMVCGLVGGVAFVPMLLDPYSAYGRIASNLLRPVWLWLSGLAGSAPVMISVASLAGLAIAVATVLIVGFLAARGGRTWCNTVCPVGSTLGLVSRFSVFHIDIDPDKCIQCRKCEHACKASCIDVPAHTVDTSRCVVCFDCLPDCPNDAIRYTPSSHRLQLPMLRRAESRRSTAPTACAGSEPRRLDRRRFMATGIVAALAPLAMRADRAARSVARSAGAREPVATPSVCPPGVVSREEFLNRCTGCSLCVSHCPTGVLRPSKGQYGLSHLLAPVMRYDTAACSFDCTRCNNLCPTGALIPLSLREKQHTAIGLASVIPANCLHCGECASACPRKAITLDSTHAPVVNAALCIGCGACQAICPAYPFKAIYVNGLP